MKLNKGNRSQAILGSWVESLEQRQLLSVAASVGNGAATPPLATNVLNTNTASGSVTDWAGNPLAGVSVVLLSSASSTASIQTTTDANGNYAFAGVVAGTYTLRAYLAGYVTASLAPVSIVDGSNTLPALQLTSAAVITGVVSDTTGAGLSGATVSLVPATAPTGNALFVATTTDGGIYTFSYAVPGDYVVRVSKSGYVSNVSQTFTAGAGKDVGPSVQLAPVVYSTVNGTVTDTRGNPIAGASVTLYGQTTTTGTSNGGAPTSRTVTTDANGNYTATGLPAGTYTVRASAVGYLPAYSASFPVVAGINTAPTVQLVQAATITGTVTDSLSGKPIVGATVSLYSSSSTSAVVTTAKTDANGAYTFSGLAAGTYIARAAAEGYFAASSAAFAVVPGPNAGPALRLIQTATVTGQITDTAGKPIAGATVYLAVQASGWTPGSTSASVKTDANGNYTIGGLMAGGYSVYASATGYFAGASAPFTVNPGSNVAPTLQLVQAATVTGAITDATGKGIAGAAVTLYAASTSTSGSQAAVGTAKTDASGNYSITGLRAGTYFVRASATGYLSGSSASFAVVPGSNAAPTVQLVQVATFTGSVTDTSGKPIVNATVLLLNAAGVSAASSVKTDANGVYTFTGLVAGTYAVRAYADGYLSATSAAFPVAPGSNTGPTVILTKAATITGTVTDTSGKAIAGASVSLLNFASTGVVTTVKTDANGNYSFTGLAAGTYSVRASAVGYLAATSNPFGVAPGANVAPTLQLIQAATVTGTITDTAGKPIAGASVTIYAATTTTPATTTSNGQVAVGSAKTDANGNYSITGLAAGTYTVRATATGYFAGGSAPFPVAPGANTAPTVQLVQVSTVAGTITDTAGKPIAGATVYLLAATAGTTGSSAAVKTDANGNYSITGLAAGTYTVRAYATGYLSGVSQPFAIVPGANTAPTVQLIQAATVNGSVTDTNGNPIAGATVTLYGSTNAAAASSVKTDANGSYSFTGLVGGTYTVRASASGYFSGASQPFAVVPGANSAPTVQLVQVATVTGTITDTGGKPIAGATVYLLGAVTTGGTTSASAAVKTDANGNYSVTGLAAGTYSVHAAATGYFPGSSAAFNVVPGSNTAPTLALAAAAVIGGTVTTSTGTPLAGATVSIYNAVAAGSNTSPGTSPLATVTSGDSGQYTFPSLPAGTYIVKASKTGYTPATSAPFVAALGANTAPTLTLTAIVTGTVTGTVTNAAGASIAGAYVYLVPTTSGLSSISGVKTDANGNYTFTSVPTGSYTANAVLGTNTSTGAKSAVFQVLQGANTAPTLIFA